MSDAISNKDYSELVRLATEGLSLGRSRVLGKLQVTVGSGDNIRKISGSDLINQTFKNLENEETKAEATKMLRLLQIMNDPKPSSVIARICRKIAQRYSKDAYVELQRFNLPDDTFRAKPQSDKEDIASRLKAKEAAIHQVSINPGAFCDLSDRLKNDREVIQTLLDVTINGSETRESYQIGIELLKDRNFALAAVKVQPSALRKLSDDFKNDLDIVLNAVQRDGDCLSYATSAMKNHKAVVLEAVRSNGRALEFASEDLKNDRDVVKEALKDKDALYLTTSFVGAKLQRNTNAIIKEIDRERRKQEAKALRRNLVG